MRTTTVFVLLLLLNSLVFAADGDITAVSVVSDSCHNGFVLEIMVAGADTGGTYDFGLGVYNDPSTAKVTATVYSPGFDDNGDSTTVTRTLYGTSVVHMIYPNHALEDEEVSGSDVIIRIALSDYVCEGDSLTVSIADSLYQQGGIASSSVTDMAVTNNSTVSHPKVIANWSWPGWERITGSSFDVRCVAFHRSARQGKSVKVVRFIASDESGNADTTFVTAAEIDSTLGDACHVIEYIGTLSTTNLTQGDLITVNFKAYPWIGDSGACLDTGDGVNTMPTPLYAPQYYLLDKTGAYGCVIAVVDSVAGNDGTGAVASGEIPTNAYSTLAAAESGIVAYNNANNGHNDAGGGIIYLKAGSYTWTGGANTPTDPECWLTVERYPGVDRGDVFLASKSGDEELCEKTKIKGVTIINSTAIMIDNTDYAWVDSCLVAPTGAATLYRTTCTYITRCRLWDSDVLKQYSTSNASRVLVRGCETVEVYDGGSFIYTLLGCDLTINSSIDEDTSGQTIPTFSNVIRAYNFLTRTSDGNPIIRSSQEAYSEEHGIAVIQNVLEKTILGVSPALQIAADTSQSDPVNNVLIWHNVVVGQRANLAYNDYTVNTVGTVYRNKWSLVGNMFGDWNFVHDGDTHGSLVTQNGDGNHSQVYQVGGHGNINLQRGGTTAYSPRFHGLNSIDATPDTTCPKFMIDASVSGTGDGDGDYRIASDSPAVGLIASGTAVLPYDLWGQPRANDGTGDAGVYEYDPPSEGDVAIPAVTSTTHITPFSGGGFNGTGAFNGSKGFNY